MDLKSLIAVCEANHEFVPISAPVTGQLELAAIVRRVMLKSTTPPVLHFTCVDQGDVSCITHLFATKERIAHHLIGNDGVSLHERMNALSPSVCSYHRFMDYLHASFEDDFEKCSTPQMSSLNDLSQLPTLKYWPNDAGSYLSLAVAICRNKDNQQINCGVYRIQIHGPYQATVHFLPNSDGYKLFTEYQKCGEPMPVALVLGCDIALIFAAVFPLASAISEFTFAHFIQNQPLKVYQSQHYSLPIPIASQVVIEGYIDPNDTLIDGPFGNHEGYYSEARLCPVLYVQNIVARDKPIIPITVVGPPPNENMVLGSYITDLLIPLVKREIPQVIAIVMPQETIFHRCAFVQLHVDNEIETVKEQIKRHPLFIHSKLLVFVSDDIDVMNPHMLYWHVINYAHRNQIHLNFCYEKQVVIDVTANSNGLSKLTYDHNMTQQIQSRWLELGLGVLNSVGDQ